MGNSSDTMSSDEETASRSDDVLRSPANPMPNALKELEEVFSRNPLMASFPLEALVDSQAHRSDDVLRFQADPMQNARASVKELEEEFTRNRLVASFSLEALVDSEGGKTDISCELNMKVAVCLPDKLADLLKNNINKTHLILVADKSSSMTGNPWDQVKQAILDVVNDSLGNDNITVDIITYSDEAEHVVYTRDNYQQIFGMMEAYGSTNFNSAFLKVDEIITAQDEDFSSLVVIFLTDGNNNWDPDNLKENTQRFKRRLLALDIEVTVHAVGFSTAHDYEFLQSLRHIGSKKGIFRYCEPGYKPTALMEKIKGLYQVAVSKSSVSLFIRMLGTEDKVIYLGVYSTIHTIPGQITDSTPVKFLCATWIYMGDPYSIPDMAMQLEILSGKGTLKIPLIPDAVNRQTIELEKEKEETVIAHLALKTDIFTAELVEKIQKNKDIKGQVNRVIYLRQKLDRTPKDDEGRKMEVKELMQQIVKNIKKTVNVIEDLMDRYLSGETDSASMMATAQDLQSEPEVRAPLLRQLQRFQ